MFTISQIQDSQAKVKSGADFRVYVQALIQMGVTGFDLFVHDRQATYYGKAKFSVKEEGKYPAFDICQKTDAERLRQSLKLHHEGKMNYMTFCENLAKSGIEKWTLNMKNMTCTYFDTKGTAILSDQIPAL